MGTDSAKTGGAVAETGEGGVIEEVDGIVIDGKREEGCGEEGVVVSITSTDGRLLPEVRACSLC